AALVPSQMSALPQPFSGSTIHGGSPALLVPQSASFGIMRLLRSSPGADDGAGSRRSLGPGSPVIRRIACWRRHERVTFESRKVPNARNPPVVAKYLVLIPAGASVRSLPPKGHNRSLYAN